MKTRIVLIFLGLLLVLTVAGCSLAGITWVRDASAPAEPTRIPLQAPLRRVLQPFHPLALFQAQLTLLAAIPGPA